MPKEFREWHLCCSNFPFCDLDDDILKLTYFQWKTRRIFTFSSTGQKLNMFNFGIHVERSRFSTPDTDM